MDNVFKQTQYPLASFRAVLTKLDDYQADVFKDTFLDFKLVIYSNSITASPLAYLTKVERAGSLIVLQITVKAKFDGANDYINAGTLNLNFNIGTSIFSSSYGSDTVRVHFDSADMTDLNSKIFSIDGHASFKNVVQWLDAFSATIELQDTPIMFEPSTISLIGNHAVDKIRCQSAKPLIRQTVDSMYESLSSPVTGKVNILGGNNCIISLQEFNNTVLISAVNNANGTLNETCGVWKDKQRTSEEDILCSEGIYSIGGAFPDESGNLLIAGDYPITVSSLTKDQLPDTISNYINENKTRFSHIERFIFIGTPTRALESSCNPVDPPTCSNSV